MKFEVTEEFAETTRFGEIKYIKAINKVYGYEIKVLNQQKKYKVGDKITRHYEDCFTRVKRRLSKIGINIEFSGNAPWVYLDRINGNRVNTIFGAKHGFCVGFLTDMRNLSNRKEMFKYIREVVNNE